LAFSDGPFWAKDDGTQPHEIKGLTDFEWVPIDTDWEGYTTGQKASTHAGIVNLRTGEYHTFQDVYSDLFSINPSPNGDTVVLRYRAKPQAPNSKITIIPVNNGLPRTFDMAQQNVWRDIWSPDSSKLALYALSKTGVRLHILRADGTEERRIDNVSSALLPGTWTNCNIGH
jgi:tricorn protease-like protein